MTDGEEPEELTPAERALTGHLALLRDAPPRPGRELMRRIMHTARWQRAVRRPLLAIGHLAAAVGNAIRLLIAPAGGRR